MKIIPKRYRRTNKFIRVDIIESRFLGLWKKEKAYYFRGKAHYKVKPHSSVKFETIILADEYGNMLSKKHSKQIYSWLVDYGVPVKITDKYYNS